MSNTLTDTERFDTAFARPTAHARMACAIVNAYANSQPVSVNGYTVQMLGPGIANVTDNGVTLLVQDNYCAHCAAHNGDNGTDGEGLCRHKAAMFEAENPVDGYSQERGELQAMAAGR